MSGFVTGDQGMGHVILNVVDTEKAYEFYVDVLGFAERNSLELPGGTSYFLGCNARQHTLGLNPAQGPALLHLMVETADIDDVGKALDRVDGLGIPMMQSLGKHTNDRMLSFYVYSPTVMPPRSAGVASRSRARHRPIGSPRERCGGTSTRPHRPVRRAPALRQPPSKRFVDQSSSSPLLAFGDTRSNRIPGQ